MKKKTRNAIRQSLMLVGGCFLVAAFLHGFQLTQQYLARVNFENGVRAGIEYCMKPRPGNYLPNGDDKGTTLEYTQAIRK